MQEFLDKINKIRSIFRSKNIVNYRVRLYNSGFGDILINASWQSFFCDFLGLNFIGLENKNLYFGFSDNKIGKYYNSFFERIGFCDILNNEIDNIFYIDIDDIISDIDDFLVSICNIKNNDTVCVVKRSVMFKNNGFISLAQYLHKNIYENAFIDYYHKCLQLNGFYDNFGLDSVHDLIVTIHLRLGDSAVLLINKNGDLINIGYMLGKNCDLGCCCSNVNNNDKISSQYKTIIDLKNFVNKLRQIFHNNIEINLVTDGFENTRHVLVYNTNLRDNINKIEKVYSDDIVHSYMHQVEQCIMECNFDSIVIGDDYNKFIETQKMFLKSDILISYQRPFVVKNLFAFKKYCKPQLVFSNDFEPSLSINAYRKNIFIIEQFSYEFFYSYINNVIDGKILLRSVENDVLNKVVTVIKKQDMKYFGKSYKEFIDLCNDLYCKVNEVNGFFTFIKVFRYIKEFLYSFDSLKLTDKVDNNIEINLNAVCIAEYILCNKRKDKWYGVFYLTYKLMRKFKND